MDGIKYLTRNKQQPFIMLHTMFERYTEQARRIIFHSRFEAKRHASSRIEAEHLLMGLLGESPQTIEPFLQNGLTVEALLGELSTSFAPFQKTSVASSVDMPLAVETKRALADALLVADALKQTYIGPELLLLGLLSADNAACRFLGRYGISKDVVRASLDRIQSAPERPLPHSVNFQGGAGSEVLLLESHRVIQGLKITLLEGARISDDGRSLTYVVEVRGPNVERHFEIPFNLP